MTKSYFVKIFIVAAILSFAVWNITLKVVSPDTNLGYWVLLWPIIAAVGITLLIFILLWFLDFIKNNKNK